MIEQRAGSVAKKKHNKHPIAILERMKGTGIGKTKVLWVHIHYILHIFIGMVAMAREQHES